MIDLNLPRCSGVYCVRNTATGGMYIGGSTNIRMRCLAHRRALKRGSHSSCFQAEYEQHPDTIVYEVLCFCAPADLAFYEQLIAKASRPKYNIRPISRGRTTAKEKERWLLARAADWRGKPVAEVAAGLFLRMKADGLYSLATTSVDGNRIVQYMLTALA